MSSRGDRMKKYLKLMFHMTKGYRSLYIIAYLMMFVAVGLTLFNNYILKIYINLLSFETISSSFDRFLIDFLGGPTFVRSNLLGFLIILGLIAVFKIFLDIGRGWIRALVNNGIARDNQMRFFRHVERLPYAELKKIQAGDIIQRITQDEEQIRRFLINQLMGIVNTLITVVFAGIILFFLNWKIGLSSLIVIPFLFIYSFFLIKHVRNRYRKTDESEGVMAAKIQETLTAIRVIKAFNREQYEIDEFEKKLMDYKSKFIRWRVLSSTFFSTTDILIFGQLALSLVVGIYLASQHEIDIGTLTLATSYVWMIVWPVRDVATMASNIQRAIVGMERIQAIMDMPEEDIDSGATPPLKGSIELSHVSFHYEDSQDHQLKDVSLKIEAGQTVAIMGKTGSGKSTFAALLTRLHDYTEGSIKIDGYELNTLSKQYVRRKIATVLQEPFLFSKSILNNIRLALNNASDEQVFNAAKIASIHESILNFEKGYETPVGERGISLSGGQKQRIAIARTVIMDAPILVFDDSLSAVDTETDIQIRNALKDRVKGVTTLIVTHRIATAKSADLIIVLENGHIVQKGSHHDLIQQEGLYRRVYEIQSRLD